MFLVMALLAVQAQDSAKGPKPPTPLTNPSSWITDDDYPPSAKRQRHEGTVEFRLKVGPGGVPIDCTVTQSSSFDELDERACSLLVRRARFWPARDAAGNAMAFTYTNRFTWRLGSAPPHRNGVGGGVGAGAPIPPAELQLTVARLPSDYRQPVIAAVSFEANQRVVDCRILESSGNSAIDRAACGQLLSLATAPSSKSGALAAKTAEYIVSFRTEAPAKP
ncbi:MULTISPECIES: energy transducer TonB [Sphingomonas]|uniref:TonB family protein n=1 Tax=Sphingomonas trueperi TaxID=53317 RepID=A0A7X6BBX9_9SPHN|nr:MULTISPECIES: energy transducer TonB [Sphingomonas]NJB97474.1 TonB family protein [Sphingomonas trueperi]